MYVGKFFAFGFGIHINSITGSHSNKVDINARTLASFIASWAS